MLEFLIIFVLKLETTHPVVVYKISRFFESKTNSETSTDRHTEVWLLVNKGKMVHTY